MKKPVKFETAGKKITVFENENENVPVVYANMYSKAELDVLCECEKLACKPFHLVSVTGLRWDEELSPWQHGPVVSQSDHFTGEAEQYARFLTEKIIPSAEEILPKPRFRVIAGYSMGGLFALYAPYITEAFSRAVSASGSVWYPGFVEYVKTHDFLQAPDAIYRSLGDKESRTKNQYLSRTENCMNELYSFYQSKGIDSIYELNQGNHFRDVPYRLAKGIAWVLK